MSQLQRTFAMIKPDAVSRASVGEIIAMVVRAAVLAVRRSTAASHSGLEATPVDVTTRAVRSRRQAFTAPPPTNDWCRPIRIRPRR